MPVGRIYQAPAVANTIKRNPPVFGMTGLKSVSNSDLVITGKAVRSNKSKSKSPSPQNKTPENPPGCIRKILEQIFGLPPSNWRDQQRDHSLSRVP